MECCPAGLFHASMFLARQHSRTYMTDIWRETVFPGNDSSPCRRTPPHAEERGTRVSKHAAHPSRRRALARLLRIRGCSFEMAARRAALSAGGLLPLPAVPSRGL